MTVRLFLPLLGVFFLNIFLATIDLSNKDDFINNDS